jgi:hypothetical protein
VRIEKMGRNVTSELLQIQIEDYVGFLRRLISIANIMSKRFYVVVSYASLTKQSGFSSFSSLLHHQATGPLLDQDTFTRYREEINNRANVIAGGLGGIGLKVSTLSTQQLIELFYTVYNPDIATEERLTDIGSMESGLISAPSSEDPNPQPSAAPTVATPQAPSPTGLETRLQAVAQGNAQAVAQLGAPDQIVTPPTS